mgnify:CR=1 FL=1
MFSNVPSSCDTSLYNSGSDAANMRTTAKQEAGGDWLINGTKMWITNGNLADVAVVWARADDGTIRKEFALSVGENSVHGSDAPETAAVEIAYFFAGIELVGSEVKAARAGPREQVHNVGTSSIGS